MSIETMIARKVAERLQALISGGPQVNIQPGEAWSDAALADLKKLKSKSNTPGMTLLIHCQSGGKGKLTDKWAKAARPLIDAVGFDAFKQHVLRWFPLVDKPRTQSIGREHQWAARP